MNPISADANLMASQGRSPAQPVGEEQVQAQSPQIVPAAQASGLSSTGQTISSEFSAAQSKLSHPGLVEPIVPPSNPILPADAFTGFGMSKEEEADQAYAEYLASQTRTHIPMHEEATEGDPYYGARREKVSGLSPYVAEEPAPQRSLGNLPPAKGAAHAPSQPAAAPAQSESISEPAFYENALPLGMTEQGSAASSYSGVPPLPPPVPKSALGKRNSVAGGGPPVHNQGSAPSQASPASRAQTGSFSANQAGPVASNPAASLPSQAERPLARPAAPPAPPAPPLIPSMPDYAVAPQGIHLKPGGHEYRAAVDIAALHALRGQNAYLDPALLHGIPQSPIPEPTGGLPVCSSCGNGLEANARFCGECGYSLPERIAACLGCAAPLEPGAKFCGECGTPVLAQAAPPPQAAPISTREKGKTWMIKFLKFLEK